MLSPAATTHRDGNIVAKGLELMLKKGNPGQSYTYFNKALDSNLKEGERSRCIQYRDAAAASLVRIELEGGDNFAQLGKYGSALAVYSSIQSASSIPIMLQYQMLNNSGACLARLGRKEEALTKELKALALNPSSTITLRNVAILLADMGYYKEAVYAFDAYLVTHPDSYSALCGKAGCLKDLRLFAQSEMVAELAELCDPKMLRGRCAQEIKHHCRQEVLKIKRSKALNHPSRMITESLESLESLENYFSPLSKCQNKEDFKFEKWLESIKSDYGDKNIFEDFNLRQHIRCEALPKQTSINESSRNFKEDYLPVGVRLSVVNSTPTLTDKSGIPIGGGSLRVQTKSNDRSSDRTDVSDLTPDIFIKNSQITPTAVMHNSIKSMTVVVPSEKYSTTSTGGDSLDSTPLNFMKLKNNLLAISSIIACYTGKFLLSVFFYVSFLDFFLYCISIFSFLFFYFPSPRCAGQ